MSTVGYSYKINDPAFAKYVADSKRYAWIFAWILTIAFVGGFSIYGATSNEMENPQAFLIGCGLGFMMLVIAFFTNLSKSRGKTWDGVVLEHKIEKKQRKVYRSGNDYYMQDYQLFKVIIKGDNGEKHELSAEDDETVYNYYHDGDKVRHHGKINTFEKYDKSKDDIIFCNACASLNQITDNICFRCKCPLLK